MAYTKTTDFAAKDALLTGNPLKLVKGTEIGAEFDAIETEFTNVQNAANITLTSVSGTDTITAGAPDPFTAYANGQEFSFIAAGTNTGAATLNIDSVGAIDIKKNGGTALSAGDITSGAFIKVKYVSATGDFEMMGGAGGGGGVALSDNNTWTGTNTFRNAAGIRSEQAATQDAIALVGRAGGTGSYEATITPATLTADRTVTVPDASGTMAYTESGSFTGTLTGCTTSPTATFRYTKVGNQVTISTEAALTGTSNSTSKTITGIPAGLYPSATVYIYCQAIDNGGTGAIAVATINTSGVITASKNANGDAFTASGSCTVNMRTFSYSL